MTTRKAGRNRGAWLRWLLLAEALILLFALAGPGRRRSGRHEGDRALIARFFFEEPSFLQAVAVNLIALHLFIAAGLFAAWLSAKRKGLTRDPNREG